MDDEADEQRAVEAAVSIILPSTEDQKRVAEALVEPPKPSSALRRAFDHRRRLFGEDRTGTAPSGRRP